MIQTKHQRRTIMMKQLVGHRVRAIFSIAGEFVEWEGTIAGTENHLVFLTDVTMYRCGEKPADEQVINTNSLGFVRFDII